MFAFLIFVILLFLPPSTGAENVDVEGEMTSEISYRLSQKVITAEGVQSISLSFVVPQEFNSTTYVQSIDDFNLNFIPQPQDSKISSDHRGNKIISATWKKTPPTIDVNLTFKSAIRTWLKPLVTTSPFPLAIIDPQVKVFLQHTPQVQADHPRVRQLALRLTKDVTTQFDAVQRIISFVVDHLQYVSPPTSYDALYSLDSGKGNCQNFSHLSAALLRAVGIPARIVNGITINQPFDVTWQGGTLTFKMGQGRHSWIEIWFPDLLWVPFDPQSTQLFISNRFIRVEVGIDNNETKNDGLMRWSQLSSAKARPQLMETISADFKRDQINLKGTRQPYGPRNLLLTPEVRAQFQKVTLAPPPPPPASTIPLKDQVFDVPFIFGNLVYPEGVDFAFPYETTATGGNQFEMTKSFLVETAEYVTTQLTQYAQVVILDRPVKLHKVGLALYKFGGDGWLWLDIYSDDNGKPGAPLATSEMLEVDKMLQKQGYNWIDFSFTRENQILAPGSYWIALGFTGSPIINWFYTYGKPVGPVYGTRYKGVFQDDWSGALGYEFNYRLTGMTSR